MSRSPSFVLFGLTLCLSLAFVIWWTIFQAGASRQLAAAGERLAVGDTGGVAAAFGVADGAGVRDLAHARYWMFVSEGAVFGLVLLVAGALFAASSRREAALRAAQNRFLAGAYCRARF